MTDLFSVTPKQEPEPAPAEEACLSQPGKSTAAGQHWVYRVEGRRKCWFQAAEDVAVKKQTRHRPTKPRVATREETEDVPRKRKAIDARAELLRPAPVETSQPPMRPAPELKMADAASVPAMATAALVSPTPIESLKTDRLMPEQRTPRQINVETLLAAAPAARDAVDVSAAASAPITDAADDGSGWIPTWLGVLLMALGLVSVLVASRPLREAVLLRD